MREQIYTIPVTDAFRTECECPICILEKKLEEEYVDYMLGPSLMEPEGRMETNEKGFCRHHFEQLYSKQSSRHGFGLILDTYLAGQTEPLRKDYEARKELIGNETGLSLLKNLSNKVTSKQTETEKYLDETIARLDAQQGMCAICARLEKTMDRYMDVILYLWFKEDDFHALFSQKKGFCMRHFNDLLKAARKYLNAREKAIFVMELMEQQMANMERVQQEVNWFTKKFDYRYNDAPWGNSRDAVPRSIEKIVGHSDLK